MATHAAQSYTEVLTQLVREFMAGLREHLAVREEQDPDLLAERVFAAASAAAAVVVLLLPLGQQANTVASRLLAVALRYLARRAGP